MEESMPHLYAMNLNINRNNIKKKERKRKEGTKKNGKWSDQIPAYAFLIKKTYYYKKNKHSSDTEFVQYGIIIIIFIITMVVNTISWVKDTERVRQGFPWAMFLCC